MTISTIDIQKNVLKELGRNPEDTVMQSRALRWLNKTLDKVQGYLPDVEFLQASEMEITLTDGTATYIMPSDFFHLSQVRIDAETRILEEFSHEEFDRVHPDPTNEDEDIPSDFTFEYDRNNGRHVMRVGPIPDASYVMHGILKRWHPKLTSNQGIQYDKLETCLEEGAFYHGARVIYTDPSEQQWVANLKQDWLESIQSLTQILAMNKPRPSQIRVVLRKSDY